MKGRPAAAISIIAALGLLSVHIHGVFAWLSLLPAAQSRGNRAWNFRPSSSSSSTSSSTIVATYATSFEDIPFDEAAIRMTYDEWRPFYGKGDFDLGRYEIFRKNYKTLTAANLAAREEAAKEGRPIPPWMQLNEYADCTEQEYESLKGRLATSSASGGSGASAVASSPPSQSVVAVQRSFSPSNYQMKVIPASRGGSLVRNDNPHANVQSKKGNKQELQVIESTQRGGSSRYGPKIVIKEVEIDKPITNADPRLFLYYQLPQVPTMPPDDLL